MSAVQAVVDGDRIFLATQRCADAVADLEWDADDVAQLIAALLPEDYRNSEWCSSSRGQVYDADVYRIFYDHIGGCRGYLPQHRRFYIKFGFRPGDWRLTLWVFSCHPTFP